MTLEKDKKHDVVLKSLLCCSMIFLKQAVILEMELCECVSRHSITHAIETHLAVSQDHKKQPPKY